MKKFGFASIALLGLVGLLLLVACQQQVKEEQPKEEAKASPASIVRGGQIYDEWWTVVEGAAEPKDNQPLWAFQTSNTRSGAVTWRCQECHGWDYQGQYGAYNKADSDHYTGFLGVYDASLNKTKAQLLDVLKGKTDSRHNFASVLGETGLNDVVNFLKEGVIDVSQYIYFRTRWANWPNMDHGRELYSSTCAACHGADGKQILFDGKDSLGFLASDNPWEVLHKIRFGQPGATMPSGVANGWSAQDATDVLGHAQILPK